MIPDTNVHERRIDVVRELPWPIPATVIIRMSDLDLDLLDAAGGAYWRTLSEIVERIRDEAA